MNDLISINTKIITSLYSRVKSVVEISPNEIDLVGVIIRGILKDPDVVDDSQFDYLI